MYRKLSFFVGLLFLSLLVNKAFGQGFDVQFTQNRSDVFTLDVNPEKYDVQVVEKDGQMFSKLQFAGDINLSKAGWAELPYTSIPVQLSPDRNVDVEIIESNYVDIPLGEPMLPSRGVIYRNQDPSEIPYEIDPESIVDAWYPEQLVEDGEPYVLRKVRGQNIRVQPFRYNAAQQTLRVYTQLRIRVSENTEDPINPLPASLGDVNVEMAPVYRSLFINYNQNTTRWAEEIGEFGDVLVIYTSRDATAIQPWIEWKQQKGYHVDELQVATGTNVGADIQSAYTANPNLLYVLLVGDWAEIKSDLGTNENTPMDPMLGCVAGGDDHHDIIIGRFSAGSSADVTAQGNKAIEYERDAVSSDTWYKNALGIASAEGAGDDGEYDNDQIENIHNDRLLETTYTTCHEQFDPSASASGVQSAIDGGVSVINYCGHGANTYWVSSGYGVSEASSSTNGPMYPYAFSVACVVGAYHSGTCFAEAMLRNPDGGAVATWMSTMNQPWQPPMRGQDYANDLLIQGFDYSGVSASGISTTYGRTTFGSITFNAAELMVNEADDSQDWDTYKTWTIFGDPSFQVRTDQPKAIALSNMSVTPGTYTTQVNVDGSGFQGAIVSLWQAGSQPASAMTDASGNVSINHSFSGIVKLTVTGFNLETYHADRPVAVPDPPVCDFSADQTTITAGETVHFSDNSLNYPSTWDWTFDGGDPASSTVQNPVVTYNTPGTYDVSLAVTNIEGNDNETKLGYITVNPVTDPPISDFVADQTTVSIGTTVNFTDLSTNLPDGWEWTFEGGNLATSTDQNPSVIYDTPGTYSVTLIATNSIGSGNTETKLDYITVALPDYCDASGGNANYEHIANVVLGTIDNASDGQSYTDFTSISTDAYPGDDLNLVITNGSTSYDSDQAFAWADWNRDGDFEDANEALFVSATGVGPYSTTITVPAGTTTGPVRVRLRIEDSEYTPAAAPCGNSAYGEVEDYTINVLSSEPAPIADFTASTTSTCDGIVQFTDASTGASSWEWNFDDGNTSTEQNPEHTYVADGVYTVTLTVANAGGVDTHTETITVEIPDATIDPIGPFCVTADAVALSAATAGGTWSGDGISGTSFDPSIAGVGNHLISYEVTIGTCTDYDQIEVLVVDSFDASIDAIDPLCENNDPITLTAATSGGDWSGPGVTGNQFDPSVAGAGNHLVSYTVGTGTCEDSDNVLISVDALPEITITSPATICLSEVSMTLSADIADGIWSGTGVSGDVFNAETAGIGVHTITYEVTDGACTVVEPIDISVGDAPTVGVDVTNASGATVADGSANANVTGGLAPYAYAWSNGDGDATMEDVVAGDYSLTVTDAAGCETVVTDVVIDFTNSIAEESIAYAVYPNPAQDEIYIKLENLNANSIELVNVLGQTMMTRTVESNLTRLDVSKFVSGVYFIRIHANDKQFIEKLMID
jgi:gingipain R